MIKNNYPIIKIQESYSPSLKPYVSNDPQIQLIGCLLKNYLPFSKSKELQDACDWSNICVSYQAHEKELIQVTHFT